MPVALVDDQFEQCFPSPADPRAYYLAKTVLHGGVFLDDRFDTHFVRAMAAISIVRTLSPEQVGRLERLARETPVQL
jgi:hypothetical protein